MRTKGKLKLTETMDTFSLFFQGGKNHRRFFCYISKVWPDAKARAEHLVACWNAFEKGGLVEELVKVVEGLVEEANDGSARFDDPAPDSVFIEAKAVLKKAGEL